MDANGLRFWMIADANHWRLDASSHVEYNLECRMLQLKSERASAHVSDDTPDESRAKSRVEITPQTIDLFGTRAFWDGQREAVMATGTLPESIPIFVPTANTWPSDLAVGHDGVLYMAMAINGQVIMFDLRQRWDLVTLLPADFVAWRLAADPKGGVWVLDRVNNKLGRIEGLPLPKRPYGPYSPNTSRPCEENSNPPALRTISLAAIPINETPVAIACSPGGRLAVLSWRKLGETSHEPDFARLRCLNEFEEFAPPIDLQDASFPYSLTWVSEDRVALLCENVKKEALVFHLSQGGKEETAVGDMYPLIDREALVDGLAKQEDGPFLNGLTLPPHYPTISGTSPLHRLSLPFYATRGEVSNKLSLDSGSAQTVWHRLYIEASIPPNCGVKVFLAASGDETPPASGAEKEWHEHRFGEMFQHSVGDSAPRGAWVSRASEIPLNPGLLKSAPRKNRDGLFTALIQRANRVVRTLRGRYIHVRVVLFGDGRSSPAIAAIRLYGSRFSYLNRYLPELYRETRFGADADDELSLLTPASRNDFLERFVDNFEGVLTPIEDLIASSYLLTDPRTTPDEAIEWLGSWIGMTFDSAYPHDRRRKLIEVAPDLYRRRGTYDGLRLALNVVTGGMIERREVVVLEDFRLRRTFATILGADLADEDDPLLGGLAASGNSYVGDTLFLGDENKKEFLALFSAELSTSVSEDKAIKRLFDDLAHRVTILVHEEIDPQLLGLIRRVIDLEKPAHVLSRVATTSFRFLIGMSSLVGVDTFLGEPTKKQPVRVEHSNIGEHDFILRPPSLDPRLEGGAEISPANLQRPLAVLEAPEEVRLGESFTLEGSNSLAPEGKTITRYVWKRND